MATGTEMVQSADKNGEPAAVDIESVAASPAAGETTVVVDVLAGAARRVYRAHPFTFFTILWTPMCLIMSLVSLIARLVMSLDPTGILGFFEIVPWTISNLLKPIFKQVFFIGGTETWYVVEMVDGRKLVGRVVSCCGGYFELTDIATCTRCCIPTHAELTDATTAQGLAATTPEIAIRFPSWVHCPCSFVTGLEQGRSLSDLPTAIRYGRSKTTEYDLRCACCGSCRAACKPEVLGVGHRGPLAGHKITLERWGVCRFSHETRVTAKEDGSWSVSRPAEFVEEIMSLFQLVDSPAAISMPHASDPSAPPPAKGPVSASWHHGGCCSSCQPSPVPKLVADHTVVPTSPIPLAVLLYVAMIAP